MRTLDEHNAIVASKQKLTPKEAQEHARCEALIEKGLKTFFDVGCALAIERDLELYRETHGTFETYCRERWGIDRRYAYRLIDASSAVENVAHGPQIEPPQTERQARPLTKLEPEQQREAWQEAVDTAPDGKVTAKHVEAVVEKITRDKKPSPKERKAGLERETQRIKNYDSQMTPEFKTSFEAFRDSVIDCRKDGFSGTVKKETVKYCISILLELIKRA